MDSQLLTVNEAARTGFTHLVRLNYKDLAGFAAAGAQTLTPLTLVAGDVVDRVAAVIKTPFVSSDATLVSLTAAVGDNESATQFQAATQILASDAPVNYAAAQVLKQYVAADAIVVTLTPTAGKVLNTITAGELHVFLRISNPSAHSVPTV